MENNEWKSYIFSDFVSINPTIRLESSKEYSFVEMKDLNENYKYVYPSALKKLTGGARFQEMDTLFARITPCLENGKICQVKKLRNGTGFGSTEFLVFRGKDGISDTDFVYYLSRFGEVRRFAELNMLGTSGRQRVTREAFDNLQLKLPPLLTQRRIADILSALDDKIELNRQTNATLEAIAQAIFKEWFVNFNFPGATGEMVESELGLIPKGWRVGKLGEMCKIIMGQSPPGTSYNEDGIGIPFFQGRADFTFRFPRKRVYTTDPKRFANKFDILVSVRAPVGDMNIANEKCCIGRGLAAVIEKGGNHSFTYYFLKELTKKFKGFEDNGTVFGSINKSEFENMECIVPSHDNITSFEAVCRSIDDGIFYQESEIAILIAIRDALLPKLMNGEIEL
jgi:type I restriction enzyme S subunit